MKPFLSKFLMMGTLFLLTINSSSQNNKALFPAHINFLEARAKTMLSATANLSTAQGIANFIRYNYYAFNGAADDYEIQQGLGFLEVINNILGSDGIGGILGTKGYTTCSSIPTSGESSGSISGNGQTMQIQFSFGTGIRKVPAHFPHNANETYDRSVNITTGMGKYYIELKCSGGSVTTAYIYSSNTMGSGETINEAFYQKDDSTNAVYVDFYLKDVALNLIDINRFVTTNGSKFSIYHFGFDAGSNRGSAYSITGTANEKVNVNAVTVENLSGDVVAKEIFSDLSGSSDSGSQTIRSSCIDMTTNTTSTGCLALETTADLEIGTTSYDWTFDSIKTFTTSASPF